MSPEEITAAVEEVRRRVRERYAKTVPEISDFELPEVETLGHARDLADGKAAAIGTVNPRRGGPLNGVIQSVKKAIARGLNWFVRDQVDFNRAAVAFMDRNVELMAEQNRGLVRLAKEFVEDRRSTATEQADMLRHWSAWRPEFEMRLERAEVRALQLIRDAEAAGREREQSYAEQSQQMRRDYQAALERTALELEAKLNATATATQQRLWADLAKLKLDQERTIESELRVLRRRSPAASETPEPPGPAAAAPPPQPEFDYARFEERFRGDEAFVEENQRFYLPYFESCNSVVDLGCGRGELLALLAAQGKTVKGIDLDEDALAACREKGLDVERADLFEFLGSQPEGSWEGVFCAHVIEHLPARRIPELVELCRRVLRPGGVIAFETPNPGCLAIFAGDFYLDPTHERPVPHPRMHFHLQEAGFGGIEVLERHPAVEVYPELQALDRVDGLADFRRKFFGGLDYAIIARRL